MAEAEPILLAYTCLLHSENWWKTCDSIWGKLSQWKLAFKLLIIDYLTVSAEMSVQTPTLQHTHIQRGKLPETAERACWDTDRCRDRQTGREATGELRGQRERQKADKLSDRGELRARRDHRVQPPRLLPTQADEALGVLLLNSVHS